MANGPDTGGHSKRTRGNPKRAADAKAQPPVKERRDSLLSSICHDLRAPLAAVTMGANFVLQTTKRDDTNARSVRILEAMLRSCSQMERLIRNFADLSELDAGSLVLRIGVHDAGEILEVAAETVRAMASSRSVNLEVSKPAEPIAVRCDRERVLRAIEHLVENAVKHAPTGSAVSLSVARHEGVVSFAVVDRGPGLEPELMEHLFDRQWHAKRTNREGAGLGLAITRGFALAHEGRLDVASQPGVETKFTLSLPA